MNLIATVFEMDSPVFGICFVAGSMLSSVIGLLILRRFISAERLKKHHEIASYFFLMVGTLYAVLIAFAIYTVWTQYQDAGAKLESEANAVGDLSRMSAGLPDAQRAKVREALLKYIHAVLDDEFPAMVQGRQSDRTWAAVQQLTNVYTEASITDAKDQIFIAESLKHLNALFNYRRARLFTSRGTVPLLLWYLLFGGGTALVAFTYLFGHESLMWQAVMTAALAGTLTFSLFLVIAYDGPYSGSVRIGPAPYELELNHVSAQH